MKRALCIALLAVSLISVSGCKSKDESPAIRDGIVKHLASLAILNVNAMDINVLQTTVNGNQAQAQVEIRPRSDQPGTASMQLTYFLEKRGSDWVVVKSQAAGGTMDHPTGGGLPSGSMAGGQLPPGHPPVDGNAGTAGSAPSTHSNFSDVMRSAQPAANAPAQSAPPANTPSTYPHP